MKTNTKQPITYSYQLGKNKLNPNYKLEFFLNSLHTNHQFRHYLFITAIIALVISAIAVSILIPLGIKLIGWIGSMG